VRQQGAVIKTFSERGVLVQFNKRTIIAGVVIAVAVLAIPTGIYFVNNPGMPPRPGLGLDQSDAAQGQAASIQTPNDLSVTKTVTLEDTQLKSVKVEPVGEHLFAIEREAVGSISFDEDLSVVQAESTLIGAAATFEVTSKELARARALNAGNGGVSQRELEQAVSDQQTAESALKAAREAVRVFGKTEAEIDQMIDSHKIDPAQVTGASTKWGLANVPESDSPLLHVGQPIKIKVMAYPDRIFEGKISTIYATVDPDTHRTKIRCKIEDPGNELCPGMLANFVICVQDPVASAAIPVNGVVREGDGTMTVWVTTDRHTFTMRTVKVGLQQDGWYQIVEGLQRGELAVTEGGVFLSNMLNAPPVD
jgi:cobalt-zinc-cadmium efflux system membrane fusion protein